MPSFAALRPGDPERLGAYALLGRLGEGGQGVVYLARDPAGNQVAVKLLQADDQVSIERFLREAQVAQQVAPFCTAAVLGTGVEFNRPFIISEYIEGPSLQRVVQEQGPRTGSTLHRLAIGTATALAAIHQAGIVHRDFKPANVIQGADGPRVIDFGIARSLDATSTISSMPVGTPAYMAPEQILGHTVGPAADLFSWASTMIFTASGRSPFGSDTMPAVINRVLNQEPDLGVLSGPLRDVVASCLSKDPAQRPTADQVIMLLLQHPVSGSGRAVLAEGAAAAGPLGPPGTGSPAGAFGQPGPYGGGAPGAGGYGQSGGSAAAAYGGDPSAAGPHSGGPPGAYGPAQGGGPSGAESYGQSQGGGPSGPQYGQPSGPLASGPLYGQPSWQGQPNAPWGAPTGEPHYGYGPPTTNPGNGRPSRGSKTPLVIGITVAVALLLVAGVAVMIPWQQLTAAGATSTPTAKKTTKAPTTKPPSTPPSTASPTGVPTTGIRRQALPGGGITLYEHPSDPVTLTSYEVYNKKQDDWIDYARGSLHGTFTKYAGNWESLVSPDGRYLASRGRNYTSDNYDSIIISDRQSGGRTTVKTVKSPLISSIRSWSKDGSKILLNIEREYKNNWTYLGFVLVDTKESTAKIVKVADPSIRATAFGWDGQEDGAVNVVGKDKGLRFFDTEGKATHTAWGVGKLASGTQDLFSPSGKVFVTECPGGGDGDHCLWDSDSGDRVRKFASDCDKVLGWYDETHLFCWEQDNGTKDEIQVVDFNGKLVRKLLDIPGELDFSPVFTVNPEPHG